MFKNLKFSLITPEHSPKNIPHLLELYDTIENQTHSNWEWILFLNNGCLVDHIPDKIKRNPKVVIFQSLDENTNIGAIKNAAFSIGSGDILVEVDHDDLLTSNCLQKLNEAFQNDDVGFVYSDNAILHMRDEFVPYGEAYGWSHRKFDWKGKELIAMNSFPPSSHSVSYIWYAPDHVRAWRKSIYDSIGGHNPELSICDDHELMIRTYLATKMHHINEVLYIYRVTGDNTWLERNQAIQDTTRELFKQYAWDLACKDAKDRGLDIVELGGGINPRAGCNINIDLEDGNVTADLNNGIPLPDNSVGVINASHILEHLHDKHKIMAEIHRVLADDGWVFIQVPSTDGRGAFQDPTHVSYWNENCFWYYTRKDKAMFIRNDKIRFQEFKLDTFWWEPRSDNIAITDAWLVAIKSDKRRPHPVKI